MDNNELESQKKAFYAATTWIMENPRWSMRRISRETGIDIRALNGARRGGNQLNEEQLAQIDRVRPGFLDYYNKAIVGQAAIKPEDVAAKLDTTIKELAELKEAVASNQKREEFFIQAIQTEREYREAIKKQLDYSQ